MLVCVMQWTLELSQHGSSWNWQFKWLVFAGLLLGFIVLSGILFAALLARQVSKPLCRCYCLCICVGVLLVSANPAPRAPPCLLCCLASEQVRSIQNTVPAVLPPAACLYATDLSLDASLDTSACTHAAHMQ